MEVSNVLSGSRAMGKLSDSILRNNDQSLSESNQETRVQEESHAQYTFNSENVSKVIDEMNTFLRLINTHLKFNYHEGLDRYYVQVINDDTKEVIREIPPKKFLDIAAMMWQQLGLLFDKKV